MKDRIMTHASLCTGIGACELAATWMGWENLFSCEIDEFCNKVLKYHYPNATHYGNIFEQDFREWRGRVDVLTAGFPCQVYSLAGKRLGDKDDRYLWPQVLRVIDEIRPTWFVGENVAGILSMVLTGEEVKVGSYTDVCGESYSMHETRQVYAVEQIKRDLASIGYSLQPVVIPACAVGAPHRRDRVWFIATDADGNGHSSCGTSKEPKERWCENIPQQEKRGNSTEWIDGLFRFSQFTPDTDGAGLPETRPEQRAAGIAGDGLQRDVTDTSSVELQGGGKERDDYSQGKESRNERSPKLFFPGWQNFPTQSPVCSRDDGISLGLSGITFSRWRQESIKALGNSMVPQVVLEIFKAIEQVENTK